MSETHVQLSNRFLDLCRRKSTFIAIGDIHGCHAALATALEILEPVSARVVFLGDYVNRGPSSVKTVETLVVAQKKRPDWIFLLGNHEAMLLETWAVGTPPRIFPGLASIEYAALGAPPHEHQIFFKNLLHYYESDTLLFVHGGVATDCDRPIDQHPVHELIWTYQVSPTWSGKTLVRGHQIVETPEVHPTHISLDTGCFKGRHLTLGVLDDSRGTLLGWVQVSFDGKQVSEHWVPENSPT